MALTLTVFLTTGVTQYGDDWTNGETWTDTADTMENGLPADTMEENGLPADTMTTDTMPEDMLPADTMPEDTMLQEDTMDQNIFGEDGANQNGADQNGLTGQPSVGELDAAPTPQYWVADASLFVQNARTAADIISKEANLDTVAPEAIANQARYLESSISRAINDMNALHEDAAEMNQEASDAIEQTLQNLESANQQVAEILQTAQTGDMGPTFTEMISSTVQTLEQAAGSLDQVARAYNAREFSTSGARKAS